MSKFILLSVLAITTVLTTMSTRGQASGIGGDNQKQEPALKVAVVCLSEEYKSIVVGLRNYNEKKPNLVLYLDGVDFPQIPALPYPEDLSNQEKQEKGMCVPKKGQEGEVVYRQFLLEDIKVSQHKAWKKLYRLNGYPITEKAVVDVAIWEDNNDEWLPMEEDSPQNVKIPLVSHSRLFLGVLLVIPLLLLFLWLAGKTRIIRAVSETTSETPITDIPYSLGRAQMAIWFFLVAASYLLIWAVTGEVNSITKSELVLLGISASTALGAAVLDNRCPSGQLCRKSEGFLTDVISDQKGITFHRFQILGWTLVLGMVYLVEVVSNLSPPKFEVVTLALMGISSGTYLGFKFPEPKDGVNDRGGEGQAAEEGAQGARER